MNDQFGKSLRKVLTAAKCPKCGTMYRDTATSTYVCSECGYEEPTSFGIVRAYLEEHGNSPAMVISRDTNVPINEINNFLRHGRLEIPEDSEVFINCKRCGIEIRYGKYCPACAQELTRELKSAFEPDTIGAIPKGLQGKMHSLNHMRDKR